MDNAIGVVTAPGGAPDVRLVSHSHPAQTLIEAAAAGLGAAVAQRPLVEAHLTAGRLAAPHGFVGDGAVFAAFHRRGEAGPPARRLLAWLEDQGRRA